MRHWPGGRTVPALIMDEDGAGARRKRARRLSPLRAERPWARPEAGATVCYQPPSLEMSDLGLRL